MTQPMVPMDFVKAWVDMSSSRPGEGHYRESVYCQFVPLSGNKNDNQSRCWQCDAQALLAIQQADELKIYRGALARAQALVDGDPDWMTRTRWPLGRE